MWKQIIAIIALIVLSLLVTIGMSYAEQGIQWILSAHTWVADLLKEVFSGGQAGNLIREIIALLTIPVVIALIPAIIYWLAKRQWLPYFVEIIWLIWLVQTSALIIVNKSAV